jgi:hypothetical protein
MAFKNDVAKRKQPPCFHQTMSSTRTVPNETTSTTTSSTTTTTTSTTPSLAPTVATFVNFDQGTHEPFFLVLNSLIIIVQFHFLSLSFTAKFKEAIERVKRDVKTKSRFRTGIVLFMDVLKTSLNADTKKPIYDVLNSKN